MLEECTFDTGEVALNVAEGPPSGPPLVLLHGLPGRWQEFLPTIPVLSLRWHIYALDLRGQGRSGRTPGKYLAKYYVDDVQALLETLDEPAVIFGMSGSGIGGMAAASYAPNLVRALVVGDSPLDLTWLIDWMTSDSMIDVFQAWRELAGLALSPMALARLIAETQGGDVAQHLGLATTLHYLDPDMLMYHAEGRAREFLEGFDMDTILSRITCPMLLLQANPELGGMMTDRIVEEVIAKSSAAMRVWMPDCRHGLGLNSWKTGPLLSAVTDFLEAL